MLTQRLQAYLDNSRKIRQSYNNPLKLPENLAKKDELEKQFYDEEAQPYLDDFREHIFLYDEHEEMPASHYYFYKKLENVDGKHILDIGCGYGFTSVNLAKRGAILQSIDISPKMVELAQRNAAFNHVESQINVQIMSAQAMQFPDNSFDHVVGLGVLHHLNLELAGREIYRVLKPGGKAYFIEPRIPFKFLIFVRSIFPNKCFESPGGSQLSDKEISGLCTIFDNHAVAYFMFLRKLSRFKFFKKFDKKLDALDLQLVKHMPFLRKLYWAFVIELVKK